MNTKNLKKGMIVDNYKALCKLTDEPIKSGKSKVIQLKHWKKFIDYNKCDDSNKYIINEIYRNVNIKRKPYKASKWTKYITEDILFRLEANDYNDLEVYQRQLMLDYGMINENYCPYFISDKFPYYNMLSKEEREFYAQEYSKCIHGRLYDILNNSLTIIQKQELITVNKTYVLESDSKPDRLATSKERDIVDKIYKKYLKEKYQAYHSNRIDNVSKQKFKIDGYEYASRVLILSYKPNIKMHGTKINRQDFNNKIIQALQQAVRSRYDKNKKTFPKSYIKIMNALITYMNKGF